MSYSALHSENKCPVIFTHGFWSEEMAEAVSFGMEMCVDGYQSNLAYLPETGCIYVLMRCPDKINVIIPTHVCFYDCTLSPDQLIQLQAQMTWDMAERA